jgi:hypothetical protein
MASQAIVLQQKTQRQVQFEITAPDAGGGGCLDRARRADHGRQPIPEPPSQLDAFIDPAVRADCGPRCRWN